MSKDCDHHFAPFHYEDTAGFYWACIHCETTTGLDKGRKYSGRIVEYILNGKCVTKAQYEAAFSKLGRLLHE